MQSGVQEMEGVTMDPAGPSTLLALAEGAAGDDGNLRLLSPFALLAAEDAQPSGELPEATACRRCQSRCRPWLRWIGWGMAACVFLSMAIGAWVFQKRLIKAAFRYRSAIVHGGFMGMVVTEIVFFLWVSLLLPTTGFEVLVAFTYGFPVSFAMSMIGKTAGSIAVFSVARRFLRERALKAVNKNVVLSTLLYTAQEHCFWTVSMVRLAYIPLPIKNIGLSAFPVTVTIFSICTFLFNIPYAICWCWLGSTLPAIADYQTGDLHLMCHWQATVALAFGLTFTTVLFLVVTYYTRRLIRRVAQQGRLAALAAQDDPMSSCLVVIPITAIPSAKTEPKENEDHAAVREPCDIGGPPMATGAAGSDHCDPLLLVRQCELALP